MNKRKKAKNKEKSAEAVVQCPLCGRRFKCGEATTCQACPLARKCRQLTCPNCGYRFPRI